MKYIIKKNKRVEMLDAREFGLSPRTKIGKIKNSLVYIILDRKSRIIMQDGARIMRIVEQLNSGNPGISVGLATNAAICSKTTAYLKENGVEIVGLDKI
jgi:hypothetical protein